MGEIFDFSTFPILTTERLSLRQITSDDAPVIMGLFSAPESLRFLNMKPIETRERALDMIAMLAKEYAGHEGLDWAITLAQDGSMVGICGAYHWDKSDRHIDIGYHILPSAWGCGYATEASRAMIGWLFDHLDVHRIQADCTEGHLGSERVMLKCGFTAEGLWREQCWEHERWVNIKQFGLLRGEFEAR